MEIQSIKNRFGIIGNSPSLNYALQVAVQVANTDLTVLIVGESGVGKEVFSQIIHALSSRKHNPFIAVNCGAIPEGTIDSELFGHEKGSFTGAVDSRKGYFETVNGGTIFLDEIGEIPQHLQVKLLRTLEAKEILPIGSTTPRHIDVRVLAATNRNLKKEVEENRFREDLYYRLNIMEIHIPPLCDRPEDIPLLVDHLVKKHNPELKKNFHGIDEEVVRVLMSLPWKGNVRELDNVIEHTMILAEGDHITLQDLPAAIVTSGQAVPAFTYNLRDALRHFEKRHITRVLDQVGQDRREAAKLLDISLSSLYRKIEELGIG